MSHSTLRNQTPPRESPTTDPFIRIRKTSNKTEMAKSNIRPPTSDNACSQISVKIFIYALYSLNSPITLVLMVKIVFEKLSQPVIHSPPQISGCSVPPLITNPGFILNISFPSALAPSQFPLIALCTLYCARSLCLHRLKLVVHTTCTTVSLAEHVTIRADSQIFPFSNRLIREGGLSGRPCLSCAAIAFTIKNAGTK